MEIARVLFPIVVLACVIAAVAALLLGCAHVDPASAAYPAIDPAGRAQDQVRRMQDEFNALQPDG